MVKSEELITSVDEEVLGFLTLNNCCQAYRCCSFFFDLSVNAVA